MKVLLDDGTEAKVHEIPSNCVLIIQPDTDDSTAVSEIAQWLKYTSIFKDHYISPLVAPKSMKFTVIRDGKPE